MKSALTHCRTPSGKPGVPRGAAVPAAVTRSAEGAGILQARPASSPAAAGTAAVRRQAGFTLAEVLAALVFMAIVIPVAVEGLRIANLAGQVAVRKSEAARVAERVLNESIITTNWTQPSLSGTIIEGLHEFRWSLHNETWLQEPMRLLSVQVRFAVQGQDHDVVLSTLVDTTPPQ